jgi:hypothetical protein
MARDEDTRQELRTLVEDLEHLGFVVEDQKRLVHTEAGPQIKETGEVTVTVVGWKKGCLPEPPHRLL